MFYRPVLSAFQGTSFEFRSALERSSVIDGEYPLFFLPGVPRAQLDTNERPSGAHGNPQCVRTVDIPQNRGLKPITTTLSFLS